MGDKSLIKIIINLFLSFYVVIHLFDRDNKKYLCICTRVSQKPILAVVPGRVAMYLMYVITMVIYFLQRFITQTI